MKKTNRKKKKSNIGKKTVECLSLRHITGSLQLVLELSSIYLFLYLETSRAFHTKSCIFFRLTEIKLYHCRYSIKAATAVYIKFHFFYVLKL